ncbi:MAG: methyltransferase domain-containing protein [Planctomycetes bacterium]|nr:methyltransferase domain-containing protein [Planctomycetota bacterium]
MIDRCELCGRVGPFEPRWPGWQIVRCGGCGLIFYDGPPEANLYSESYFSGTEYRDYLADERAHRRNFRRRLRTLRRYVSGGRLLEVGCAYGLFLDEAREHFHVAGIDVCQWPNDYAREALGVEVATGEFLDQPEPLQPYDAVCMWDTLEHLPHPVRAIERAAAWLAPGGVLAVTTNDVGSLVACVRGRRWRQVHPPTHRWYFSRATLRRAVEQAGLSVEAVRYPGVSRGWASMAHGVFGEGALQHAATLGGRLNFDLTLNLRDIMYVIARKPA